MGCLHGVGKSRDFYVGCVLRLWGKLELLMWGVFTGCGKIRNFYLLFVLGGLGKVETCNFTAQNANLRGF